MAYALNFPKDVTKIIYSMRDFRYEEVKKRGGTPSRLCFNIEPHEPYPHDAQTIPAVWTYRMPYCRPIDFVVSEPCMRVFHELFPGGIMNCDDYFTNIVVRIQDRTAGKHWRLVLREENNVRPNAFHRPEEHSDDKLKQLWFQCELC